MGVNTKFRIILMLVSVVLSWPAHAETNIEHWVTSKGARVYFMPVMDLPMVDVRLVFDAGSARDNDKAGVALLTNGMLSEGAAGLSAQTLAENFETVGAQFSNGALKDMAWFRLRSLSKDKFINPALENLKRILVKPDFPEKAFQREMERLKTSVLASKQSPGAIAQQAFNQAIYGDHPYALPTEGTQQSLNKIRLRDLKQYYQHYYVARNLVVAVVGQHTRQQAERMVDNLLADLPAGQRAKAIPEVKPLTKAKTVKIDFPSSQSHVLVGQPGIQRGDADYFTLYVANHPFGGSGFASRLMDEVREKRGLAYSVYSYFMPMRRAGPFQIGLQTKNAQAMQALDIVQREFERYVAQGPTAEELDDSQKNITGGFPLRIDSNSKLVEYLSMIGFYDLPLDYLDTFIGNIKQVDQAAIQNALKRRIHPDRMVTVIVGGA
ncbi:MAG: M16 family metallopeptidase [Gammaproteobacteria bacterium]